MSEKELGRALLQGSDASLAAFDPRVMAQGIVAADKRRVWLYAAAAWLFWLSTAGGMFATTLYFLEEVLDDVVHDVAGPPNQQNRATRQRYVANSVLLYALVGGSVGTFLFASLFTVLLVLAARRATLAQINASLLDISEQLKQLRLARSG